MEITKENKLNKFFLDFPPMIFNKGEVIVRPHEIKDAVYYLNDGFVKMYTYFSDGKEFTLNIFKPGACFPITNALLEIQSNEYYKSISRVKIHYCDKAKVILFLKSNSDVLFELTKRISSGLQSYINSTTIIINGTAFHKVVYILVLLAKRFGKDIGVNQKRIIINLTHQEIANMINLSRETVSIELKNLYNEKVISYKGGKVLINNYNKLLEYSHEFEFNQEQGEMRTI